MQRARKKAPLKRSMMRRSQDRPDDSLSKAGGVSSWMNEPKAPDAAPGFDEAWKPNTAGSFYFGMA